MLRRVFILLSAVFTASGLLFAQGLGGTIEGTVRDAQGLPIPGATVTLTGAGVLGTQSVVTFDNGSFVFRALRPGTYNLVFELPGFQTLNREGIIMEGNRTFTVNVTLEVATVAETVTVKGESPVVDVKTTVLSNEFSTVELHEVPSATDVWSVLAQSPGVRMRGYDVGGSHKSQQVNYESYGIRNQNRVISEGVDTTEGSGGTGFYYDYYSIEEFTTAAAGADVEMNTPGSQIVMTVKSGGNEFSGLAHADWEPDDFVNDNLTDSLRDRGFTGNPNTLFWETHGDLGGPILTDRAWFFGGYNHFKIKKQVSGVDPEVALDIGDFDQFIGKLTIQLTQKDKFIGYTQYQLKQKPQRGLSLTTPPDSILAQNSWSWAHKAEWQRIWTDQAFSTVQFKHFGFGWPMVPKVDPIANPPRIDTASGIKSGAGWNGTTTPPFTFVRWKPQITSTLNYYVPELGGSHELKFGFDWWIDSSQLGSNSNSGQLFFFDNSSLGRPQNVDEIALFNLPENGQLNPDNRDRHTAVFAQDTWTLSNRVTFTGGVRFERQRLYFLSSENNPRFSEFFPTGTIPGQTLTTWNNWMPRLGVTYDVLGDGKNIAKFHYGRYYRNIADDLSTSNPSGDAFVRFKFLDQNQNGLFDGVQELGEVVTQSGTVGTDLSTASGTPTNPDLTGEYTDEFSASFERQLGADTSVRFSYVRKQLRNLFGQFNRAQVTPLLDGRAVPCGDARFPCPIDPFTGAAITSFVRVPDELANAQDQVIDTFPGEFGDADYDSFTVALNRRFSGGFFVQASYDLQYRDEPRSASGETQSPLNTDPLDISFFQNHNPAVSNIQDNSNWNIRALARYELPHDAAISANIRHQSGFPFSPIFRASVPGSGTQPVFLDDIDERRSQNVTIVDIRGEKSFRLAPRYGRITGFVDIFNLFNNSFETNFILRTGGSFNDIIAALDPRTFKVGVRWSF